MERLHRARAIAEERVRTAKQTGLESLPFRNFDHNAVWLELFLIAQDLITWTQLLTLDGELAVCEPKALRSARGWSSADALAAAFARLLALPPPARSTAPTPATTITHSARRPRPTAARRRPR